MPSPAMYLLDTILGCRLALLLSSTNVSSRPILVRRPRNANPNCPQLWKLPSTPSKTLNLSQITNDQRSEDVALHLLFGQIHQSICYKLCTWHLRCSQKEYQEKRVMGWGKVFALYCRLNVFTAKETLVMVVQVGNN